MSGRPTPSAAETLRHRAVQPCSPVRSDTLRATRTPGRRRGPPPRLCCGPRPGAPSQPAVTRKGRWRRLPPRDRASSRVGRESRSWAGAGRRQQEGKLEKLRFPPKPALESPGRPPPRLLFPGEWGVGEEQPRALRAAGCIAEAAPGLRACGRRRGQGGGDPAEGVGAGAAVAPAVAERRQQVAPFPAAAARPLGRGAAGGGVGARVCASVCAPWRRLGPPPARSRSLARRGRAALSRVRAPSPPPPPPFCELESVTGARVTARPSGTDSSGWKETPQPERPKRRGAGTEDARPRALARRDGRGAGVSAGKWETFLNRGSPLPPWTRGRLFTSFF